MKLSEFADYFASVKAAAQPDATLVKMVRGATLLAFAEPSSNKEWMAKYGKATEADARFLLNYMPTLTKASTEAEVAGLVFALAGIKDKPVVDKALADLDKIVAVEVAPS